MGNSLQTRKFWASQECWYISFSHCLHIMKCFLPSHHTNVRLDKLIVEDKFQALMVDDGETFRNWNRLLWGPRSTGNYWDTRRRCEASTFPPAALLLWGDRGWVRNRRVVPDIIRTVICLEILKVKTTHLYVTFLLPDLELSQCIDICWLLYPLYNLEISSVSWSVSSGAQPAQSFTPYFHQHYRWAGAG